MTNHTTEPIVIEKDGVVLGTNHCYETDVYEWLVLSVYVALLEHLPTYNNQGHFKSIKLTNVESEAVDQEAILTYFDQSTMEIWCKQLILYLSI